MRTLVCIAAAVAALALSTNASAAPKLEDYGKLPAVENLSLSPDGHKIAFASVDGERRKVIVRNVDTGATLLALDAGNAKLRDVSWLGDNHVAVVVGHAGKVASAWDSDLKFEENETSVYNLATHKGIIIFQKQQNQMLQFTFGFFGYAEKGNESFGYYSGFGASEANVARRATLANMIDGNLNLYEVNLDTGDASEISRGSSRDDHGWLVSRSGDILADTAFAANSGEWTLWDHRNQGQHIDQEISKAGEVGLVGLGRTPETLLIEKDLDGEWTFVEIPLDRSAPQVTVLRANQKSGPFYDQDTNLLIGTWTNGADQEVTLFDPSLQMKYEKARRAFKDLRISLYSMTSSLDRMVLRTTGPGDSGTYYLVDMANHRAQAVGWDYPTILQDAVATTQYYKYKAADGLDIEGVLTLPPGRAAKGLPVVVMPHGGPEAYDTLRFDFLAQAFASRGYAVFQPNFRGSEGYGKAFRDAGHGEWGRKMQTDISDGLSSLARDGTVDAHRACIVGASYGGYAAMAGVTVQAGLYRCAVSYGGLSDLNYQMMGLYGSETPYARYWRAFTGAKSAADPVLATISPVRLAGRANAPILISYGTDDVVVRREHSKRMIAALQAAGKPVEPLVLEGEDHWLSKPATRTEFVVKAVAFVEKYNPPN